MKIDKDKKELAAAAGILWYLVVTAGCYIRGYDAAETTQKIKDHSEIVRRDVEDMLGKIK